MTTIRLSIRRCDPMAGIAPHFQEYDVPVEEGMVVLEAVRYAAEKIDTTIAVRWNCEAARCGSCAAEINNVPALMCKTRIDDLAGRITVAPMRAYPIVKDLVADVSANYETERRMPAFKPFSNLKEPWKMWQPDVERSKEFRRCIECFLCQDVCHVIREHETGYFGPRHVVKAASLDTHPLDSLDRSKHMNEEGGIGYCNITKCCQEVCPEKIRITDNAIIPEKEGAADGAYDPLMRFIRSAKKDIEG
ncbi:MAG: succinate dehydrogenase/fumarate reductase iron-sulfur subunit [Candidatus Micrarchaeota archaeon]|nr:succinate dehydrogenase/fumarate reductase iron-sulfur subunit [Candidatus Micrarchaeota archaeon]